jgi:Tol biopolymer transport system component
MYAADGTFLRNLTPPDLSGAFPMMVAWSPDGTRIAFIGRKSIKPQPTPTTPPDMLPGGTAAASPLPSTSVAPIFAPVAAYNTEQLYLCNRDGFDLKPLTGREGLIYFYLSWSPDGHALVSMACKEIEWDARERESKLPQGRPRLVGLDGQERLLDDNLTEAMPVWSPDASKVATASETDVAIYDAATLESTSGARINLRDQLLKASAEYDENRVRAKNKKAGEAGNANGGTASTSSSSPDASQLPASGPPVSFNPIVILNWPQPETLYLKTAFVRTYENNPLNNFQRWHVLHLSPQSALLGRLTLRDALQQNSRPAPGKTDAHISI